MGRGRSRGRAAQKAVNARAQRGGGTLVPIVSPSVPGLAPGTDQEWFGPGQPLAPIAPRSVAGRRFDFQFGTNLNITPRQSDEFSFATLRALADRHDLTRMAIETCKDRMVRLSWGFRILDSDDDMTDEQKARAQRYRAMLRRPDGRHFWVDWLRMVLEDLLVIDAPTIFVRRTMDGSEVVGLHQIDGATIKPVIDAHGNEPEPPEAAYQQVLHGMPAVNYTTDQLIYAPRNRRVHKVYGFSPVEQIVATINIALRRQLWQHSYFTSGNIPDALIGVPSTWTPDQIRDFQDWFDSVLTGNTDRRRNGIFVPGEVAKSYVPTKDAEMFGAAEEWLARVVCFCFGIPHQALVKEVNRATADNAHEQAIEDGLAPVMAWVKSLMDRILIDVLGETELEFWWMDDKPIDPKVQDDIWKNRVDSGMANRNEWRVAVGLKPSDKEEADMLLYQGKPLGVDDQIAQQEKRNDSGVFPSAVGEESSDDVVASGGKDGAEEDEEASKAASSTTREDEHRRPFDTGETFSSKFIDDGFGLELEKKEQPRHPKGSPKGGQFASTGGAGSSKGKSKVNIHQNKDGTHTVYVNGKKEYKGTTKEAAEAYVSEFHPHAAPKKLHAETIKEPHGEFTIQETHGGQYVLTGKAGGEVVASVHTSLEGAKAEIKSLAPKAVPDKQKIDGKKIEIHANANGTHTVYVNGKKEFKGTKAEAQQHVYNTHVNKSPAAASQPAAPASPKTVHYYNGASSGNNSYVYVDGKPVYHGSKAGAIAHVKQNYPGAEAKPHSSPYHAMEASKKPATSGPKPAGPKEVHYYNSPSTGKSYVLVNGQIAYQGTKDGAIAHVKQNYPGAVAKPHSSYASALDASATTTLPALKPVSSTLGSPKPSTPATGASTGADKIRGDKAHAAAPRPPLTPSEKQKLVSYTGSGYAALNSQLRSNSVTPEMQETVKHMDSAFQKASTTESITVFRGMKPGILNNIAPGVVLHDRGFTSTSTNHQKAKNFAGGGHVLKINVPKGSRAMSVRSISHYKSEDEIVIARGGRYKIRGMETHTLDNGQTISVVGVDYVG